MGGDPQGISNTGKGVHIHLARAGMYIASGLFFTIRQNDDARIRAYIALPHTCLAPGGPK
jgi:hypothetical protein